jgi:hypothetical protein
MDPTTIDDVLSMILVAVDELDPKNSQPHVVRALYAAASWLAQHGGATSPLVRTYLSSY